MANVINELLRRTKLSYMAYNFFKKKYLVHNLPLFKKYSLNKSYFSSISNKDFSSIKTGDKPWLDKLDSREVLPLNNTFQSMDSSIQEALLSWSEKGYSILDSFFNDSQIEDIKDEIDLLVQNGKANWRYSNSKIMFAVWESKKLRDLASSPKLENILSLILGKKVRLFQSINFYKGSQQAPHSDSIHMTTFPLGFMIAVWIALEDVSLENGPLSYFPGSHKLPYLLNKYIDNEGNAWLIGDKLYPVYEKAMGERIKDSGLEKTYFLAKKGDVLIWHANLVHGGEPIINQALTRKSMVMHYFAEDVISYHELTQRPAIIRT